MDGSGGYQWNSTLRRKTPLRGSVLAKKADDKAKRRVIKRQSAKAAKRHREYLPIQAATIKKWQEEGVRCAICIARKSISPRGPGPLTPNFATEIHHLRGRKGPLIGDPRGFCPSCFFCRQWPHDNPNAARAAGVLSARNLWGVPFADSDENVSSITR